MAKIALICRKVGKIALYFGATISIVASVVFVASVVKLAQISHKTDKTSDLLWRYIFHFWNKILVKVANVAKLALISQKK